MVQLASDNEWLKRGRQKAAVAQILRRPMTPSEIWRAAKSVAPQIQLRDVWFILRQMEQRKLVTCFNPTELNGKIYYWAKANKTACPTVNWHQYAHVVRSKNRQSVVAELSRRNDRSATQIRRAVNERHSISLNSIIRAVRELYLMKLITVSGVGDKCSQKLYRLTVEGKRIASVLPQVAIRRPIPR